MHCIFSLPVPTHIVFCQCLSPPLLSQLAPVPQVLLRTIDSTGPVVCGCHTQSSSSFCLQLISVASSAVLYTFQSHPHLSCPRARKTLQVPDRTLLIVLCGVIPPSLAYMSLLGLLGLLFGYNYKFQFCYQLDHTNVGQIQTTIHL